ncbi:hypothetical protein BDP27DRAFT_1419696 [Rhodocollybia butyracea]|uniref:Uncharacterized protein n=1 Tax=Rhodocollybia butyracea TaxID=206335 RepID=A0A9P5PVF8_9AGAR|nr:hypothetical protein BDP27DRAFT_1419696 [Rhodocollybia butyracea]
MSYILLPYPNRIPPFPQSLTTELQQCIAEHRSLHSSFTEAARKTQNSSRLISETELEVWRRPWLESWLACPEKMDVILEWLEEAIYIGDFEDITDTDTLNQLGNVTSPSTQRNLVLDIIHEVDDELDELDKSSVSEPSQSISESESGHILRCRRWQKSLQDNLLNTSEDSTIAFESKQRVVALTIQNMKKVTSSIFKTSEFIKAVVKSGLATTILELSHPAYGYHHSQDPHHARLLRLHGFGLVLGDVLDRWTPNVWTSEADILVSNNPVSKYDTNNHKQMIKGKDLFNAFAKNPRLIPHVANPAAVYFLCSEENFTAAWEQWLSWSLDAAGYKVYDTKVPDLYRSTMKYLNEIVENTHNLSGIRKTWDPTILLIVEQTLVLRNLLKDLDAQVHDPEVKHCSKCTDQPTEKRCVQHINVTLNEEPGFISRWKGVGVSKVPTEQQMKPRQGHKATRGVARIVHPDKIGAHGLKRIAADEEVLQRCGKQIFKLFRNDKLCDFVWSSASSSRKTVRILDHWSNDSVWCSQPSGGRRADHYTSYAGITAETYEGIIILFEQAKLSAMLMRTARAIHPALINKINEQSKACERVGLSGLNLFNCKGYTAPQHCDDDCTPSLCAQFELQAEQKWSEFAFCAIQYGYYIESRRNTLWSFDSGLLHGTMLPSEKTVLRLRGGAASSEGSHVTTRRRDQSRAEHNQQVRHNYYLREAAWRNRQ